MELKDALLELVVAARWAAKTYKAKDNDEGYSCVQSGDIKVIVENRPHLDVVHVACRGTVNMRNWRTNLKIVRVPLMADDTTGRTGFALVHKGFLEAANSVRDEVLATIKRVSTENLKSILISGHSLGGALAVLLSIAIVMDASLSERNISVRVITFGAPAVGDAGFTKFLEGIVRLKIDRVVLIGDPIPKSLGITNFKHYPLR
jgi:predicted lipase